MKLIQNIQLTKDNEISTWLRKPIVTSMTEFAEHQKPLELSFHPYALQVFWDKDQCFFDRSRPSMPEFIWQITVVDDENREPLVHLKSENRSLLLFSEMFNGLYECAEKVGISIEYLKPDVKLHNITIRIKFDHNLSYKDILASSLIFKISLDSLLFCRGLTIIESALSATPIIDQIDELYAIFKD